MRFEVLHSGGLTFGGGGRGGGGLLSEFYGIPGNPFDQFRQHSKYLFKYTTWDSRD